ncbi:MAG: energy transducer TonB [Gammaproteobacteria bacterium]|nr:energy transducer TonB [Gammaproteobacteria bacterium]
MPSPCRHRRARIGTGRLAILALGIPALAACAGDGEVEEPAPLGDATPIEYPLEMWDQGIEGETVLQVRVNELGEVDSVAVIETSGHEPLDSAAAEGARAMRFQPGRRDGRDVPVWVRIPVQFSRQSGPES